jgi:hypothetical protein
VPASHAPRAPGRPGSFGYCLPDTAFANTNPEFFEHDPHQVPRFKGMAGGRRQVDPAAPPRERLGNLGSYGTGMMLMASTRELISIFVSLELTGISLYVLAGFLKDPKSSEAGLKYLLLGAVASAGCSGS